jgi:putative CRISPR-associated protein (TIGR02619 family)
VYGEDMAKQKRFVVSTIGISFLNAHLPADIRKEQPAFLIERANAKTLSREDMEVVDRISQEVAKTLEQGHIETIRKESAELNGLYALYENQLDQATQDMHFLIATDTMLGRRCAELVKSHLQSHRIPADIYIPSQLNTANTADFEYGCKDLINWCTSNIPGYRENGYTVVFNLVGAFKALQGYLNTIGMFYADDILYLFEGSSEAILIPRLPIRIDLDALKPFAVPIALMADGDGDLPVTKLQHLSRAIYNTVDERAIISDWGLLVWNQIRNEILGNELLPFPRLRYTSSFERDFRTTTDVTHRVSLQSALAKVAALFERSNNDRSLLRRDGSLQYETYRGYDIDHFRVSLSLRVNCKLEEGELVILNFGTHDYCERDCLRRRGD